ncbi:MAG TPA: trypsin-like peptidase domain-containing protein, partial [Pyrinomonadaceae bacterium]|nr:trypsin-like peptidase domain-containing protein [Pyrinomonadaceae bacterium]
MLRTGVYALLPFVAASSPPAAEPDVRRDATVQAVDQVMPSVVNIATETIIHVRDPFEELFRDFWEPYHRRRPPNSQFSLGSGVVIDEAGYLLTNDHVVRRADKIAVKLSTSTNVYEASVVASDAKSDVALLKINAPPGEEFHTIKFAPEDDLLLGETVLALGNPFGLGGTVTRGILSSKTRMAPKEGEALDIPNWLQTDAPINLGNSGGPLVNLRGELIGINVAVLNQAQGIGFAIPVKRVMQALGEIFPTECVKTFWFGARVKVGTTPLIVSAVQAQSPADQGGLKPGDAILQVNGKAPKSFIDFADSLVVPQGGTKVAVRLALQRGVERKTVEVHLVPETTVFNADMIRDKLGLSLEEMTPRLAARYGVRPGEGFVITGIQGESSAAAAKLERGILIRAIDGQTPSNLTGVAKLLFPKTKGERVQLEIAVQERLGAFNVLRDATVEV